MGLGLWGNEEQSRKPLATDILNLIHLVAKDHNCSYTTVKILGWFEVPENHPDRSIGDTTYIQAVETEYHIEGYGDARALYGVTSDNKVHIWAD